MAVFMCFAALIILAGLPAKKAEAAGSVTINSTNFPNPAFREVISDCFDTNEDGVLSAAEIANATELDVNDLNITSIKGIEYLTALEWLDFGCNKVETVDLSSNTKLTVLYCYDNQLTTLNVSKLTQLETLDCRINQLTALNVTNNTELNDLECSENDITSLNISNNLKLVYLECGYNNISTLDVSKHTELVYLDFNECQVKNINVSNCKKLEELYAYGNKLTSLNVSANTGLTSLNCGGNDITSLDISSNKKLLELDISATKISSLNLKNNTLLEYLFCIDTAMTSLDVSPCAKLENLECQYNKLTSLKLTYHPALCNLFAHWNTLTSINISGCKLLKEICQRGGSDGHYVMIDIGEIQVDEGVDLITTSAPAITAQPSDCTVAVGGTAKFTVAASGSNLKYQWYYRNSSSDSWKASTMACGKTSVFSFTAQESHNGHQYKCVVSNVYGSATTYTVWVTVGPKITTQPKNTSVVIGGTAKLTLAAEGTDLKYQWYYRNSSTDSWKASTMACGKTSVFSFTAQESHSGHQYFCKVTSKYGSTNSNTVTVTVNPKITTQPKNTGVVIGGTAKLTVAATGTNLKYQWYYRNSSTDSWKASTMACGKTAAFSFTAQESHSGHQYYCKVTSKYGYTNSNAVTVTVNPKITTQPKDTTVSKGATVKLTVAAKGTNLTYRWQYRNSSTDTWKNSTMACAKTSTFSFTAAASHSGHQYRCAVSNGKGTTYTKAATLTVK